MFKAFQSLEKAIIGQQTYPFQVDESLKMQIIIRKEGDVVYDLGELLKKMNADLGFEAPLLRFQAEILVLSSKVRKDGREAKS